MKKLIFTLMSALLVSSTALAQSNVTVSYPISFATGDMGDFISKPSFRGFAFDYRYKIQPNLALGLHTAWTTFYEEKASDTYTVENVSLTGKQYRYSNNVPILATATYFFSEEGMVPFGSLGIGTMYTRRNTDMNLYTLELEAWNFVVQPEFGIQYETASSFAVSLSGKYTYGFKGGSELTEPQSYFSINIGFTFY